MLYEILMSENKLSTEYLDSKKEEIFEIIPELKHEDGFDQKSSWHIYDVWKHTEVVLSNSNHDFEERLALLLHDIGKPFSYQDDGEIRHFKGHAQKSAEIAEPILQRLGYDKKSIERIVFLIKNHATKINIENVNEENIELIKKLLNVQFCDTKGYNPEKISPVLQRLDCIKQKLERFEESKKNRQNSYKINNEYEK